MRSLLGDDFGLQICVLSSRLNIGRDNVIGTVGLTRRVSNSLRVYIAQAELDECVTLLFPSIEKSINIHILKNNFNILLSICHTFTLNVMPKSNLSNHIQEHCMISDEHVIDVVDDYNLNIIPTLNITGNITKLVS